MEELIYGETFILTLGGMQCKVEFEYQHSVCSKAEENSGKP
jgi:hypothetical protein